MPRWWKFSGYGVHLFSSLAIISLSIHIIYHRNLFENQRAETEARISVLQSIVERLQSKEGIAKDELERLKKLARASESQIEDVTAGELSWKEAFFGKK